MVVPTSIKEERMELTEEFILDMNKPGTVWGMPDYIRWLEKKLIESRTALRERVDTLEGARDER